MGSDEFGMQNEWADGADGPLSGPKAVHGPDHEGPPPALKVVPTIYPTSPPVDEVVGRFWGDVGAIVAVDVRIEPPAQPLALLERLGPSPFARGGFPVIGFLATTYDKVSRYALERA